MCLIIFAYRHRAGYPFILAANRDEFYDRPTSKARFWEGDPEVLAGRDLKYGGTWMGITRSGRFAAVTNFRDRAKFREHPLSRGIMVSDYLTGTAAPETFVDQIKPQSGEYNGFNLLVGDRDTLAYYSNRSGEKKILEPGIYGLSNHLLDTPWPKVVLGRQAFESILGEAGPILPESFMGMLKDTTRARDHELPDTGFGLEWERILSSPFIASPSYGTRASTAILIDDHGKVDLTERAFTGPRDQGELSHYTFALQFPW